MEVSEVLPGVYLAASAPPALGVANTYLVAGEDEAAVIDTGHGRDDEMEALTTAWERAGRPRVTAVVLTHRHPDHAGGALRVRQALGGALLCAPGERRHIEEAYPSLGIDRTLGDGDEWPLGGLTLRFLHTPGHTVGSLCVHLPERGALFTGDTVLGTGPVVVIPGEGDMALYLRSLERLAELDLEVILPGHGRPVKEPRRYLRRLIEHRLRRERQILDHLADGARSVEDLFRAIYPRLDRRLHRSARGQIQAHLDKLLREGRVRRRDPDTYEVV